MISMKTYLKTLLTLTLNTAFLSVQGATVYLEPVRKG